MTKFKRCLSAFLAFAMVFGMFSGIGGVFAPEAAAAEATNVKTFAELADEYDSFIYVGVDVYEVDTDTLTDGKVKPGQWLEYRMSIKSDMWVGNNYPIFFYDKRFFDVRVITSTTAATGTSYEGNVDTQLYNSAHPMNDYALNNNLTATVCSTVTNYTNGVCELDEAVYTNSDQVKPNVSGDTTVSKNAFNMTSDEWWANWYVKVQDAPTINETTVYSPAKIWRNNERVMTNGTVQGDTRRPADVYSGNSGDPVTEADSPILRSSCKSLADKTKYNTVTLLLDDTYTTFEIEKEVEPVPGTSIIDTFDSLAAEYDNFIYVGADVYELEVDPATGEITKEWGLTDGYVKAGQWLEYRMSIKSDMWVGNNYPIFFYDKRFFDVRVITSTTAATGTSYEGNVDTQLYNSAHPMNDYALNNNLTATVCSTVTNYTNGVCELDEAVYTNSDQVKPNVSGDTTVSKNAFNMTSDEWWANWYVKVQDAPTINETTVYSPAKIWRNNERVMTNGTVQGDTRRPADVYSGNSGDPVTEADSPILRSSCKSLADKTKYNTVTLLLDDTYRTFYLGDPPAEGSEFTATFKVDGETVLEETYAEGEEITLPETPVKDGYTFLGWSTDGSTVLETPLVMGTADVTYIAVFQEVVKYTAKFVAEGVTVSEEKYAEGETIVAPSAPSKPGYDFVGWIGYTDGMTMPAEDVTFNADYDAVTYSVTFYTDGQIYTTLSVAYEGKYNLPAPPTKLGHDFAGWVDADENMMPETHTLTTDVAYYASWTAGTYDAVFMANGEEFDRKGTEFGKEIATPETEPTKAGHEFLGWSTDGSTVLDDLGVMDAQGKTFIAVFKANTIGVYFMDEDGTEYGYKEGDFGSTVQVIPNPTKNGYDFKGWKYADGTDFTGSSVTLGEETVYLYAKWEGRDYWITFYGETAADYIPGADGYQKCGDAIVAPQAPEKTGYVFDKWVDAQGNEMPATVPAVDNQEYFATYTAITYKATFDPMGGTFAEGEDGIYEGIYESTIVAPAAPEKLGYEFKGWIGFTEGMTMPAENVTFTADWEAKTYYVNYYVNNNLVHTDPVKYGETVPAYTYVPEDAGISFAGWGDQDPAGTTMGAEDINVYASTGVNTFFVTFTINGEEYAVLPFAYGATIEAPAYEPETGYEFSGWDLSAYPTMPAQNITIDATEKEIVYKAYFYKFETDTEPYAIVETAYGQEVEYPADPDIPGYYFDGWDKEGYVMGAGDVNIYALTTQIMVYYEFVGFEGAPIEDGEYAWGTVIEEAPQAPEVTGYDFVGWSVGGEMVAFPYTVATEDGMDLIFQAEYIIQGHKITYYVDGAIDGKPETYDFGVAIALRAEPTKTGYTFSGWTVKNTAGEEIEFPATMPEYDIEVYGTYTINKYDAIFVAENGWTETVSTEYNKAPEAPPAPEKAGYAFIGWVAEDGSVYAADALPAMGTADVTYTAKYSAGASTYTVKTYTMAIGGAYGEPVVKTESYETDATVTLNPAVDAGFTLNAEKSVLSGVVTSDNGLVLEVYIDRNQYTFTTIADGKETPVVYYYEEAVVAPEAPVKEGWTFTNWDGEVPATMPANDVTLTANFTINQYTITFDTVGGTPIAAIKNDFGTAVTVPADPTKTGYTFGGWVWTNTDTGAVVDAPAAIPAYNVTATAQWTINKYTITFVDTGDEAYEAITDDYATALEAIADPVRTGYSFNGWVWTNTDTGAAVDAPAAIPAYNVTATAQWTINQYDAIFNANEGAWADTSTTKTVPTNYAAVPAIDEPAKVGHAFAGWQAEDGTVYATADLPAMGTAAVTYTATWTPLPYDAIFDADGGVWADGSKTQTVEDVIFGTPITAPEEPTREGYIFKEWTPAVGNMIAEGMTFTAVWTQNLEYCRVQEVKRTSNLYEDGQRAFYTIEVQGMPAKVQVVHNVENGTSWTYDRGTGAAEDYVAGNLQESGLVAVQAYNAAGEEVAFNDANTAYEVWTIVTILTEGNYKVRAKVDYASWESLEFAYDYTVKYDVKPVEDEKTMVVSATPAVTSIVRGGYANVTFVTDDSVNRLRIIKDDGDGTSTIMSYAPTATAVTAYTVDEAAGTATWVLNIRFTYSGTALEDAQNWVVWYRSTEGGSGWVQSEVDFDITVTKYEIVESPAESHDPYSIISVATPEGATGVKGELTAITVVTTSDVTRVRFNDMNGRTATYLSTSNNVAYSVDEEAGTATWVISYRFNTAGEQTWGVQCRGNAWSDAAANTFTITIN